MVVGRTDSHTPVTFARSAARFFGAGHGGKEGVKGGGVEIKVGHAGYTAPLCHSRLMGRKAPVVAGAEGIS